MIARRRRSRCGFTLIELLVVIGIVAIATGMVLRSVSGDDRGAQVAAAAEQLANEFRRARTKAIDQKSIFGVAFHIQNAPGTSGRVLNNWSGGHYYRIIGPKENINVTRGYDNAHSQGYGSGLGMPPFADSTHNYLVELQPNATLCNPFHYFPEDIAKAWRSDPIPLPARKVRFIALTDQDNGNVKSWNSNGWWCDTFKDFYPRPWFGLYDKVGKRIRPWGGYDPDIKDFRQCNGTAPTGPTTSPITGAVISYTGFYYEGWDGPIPASVNTSDRSIAFDADRNGGFTPGEPVSFRLWSKDEPRPLVNADWLDAVVYFLPDGSASFGDWMRARHVWSIYSGWQFSYVNRNLHQFGPGDRCNMLNGWGGAPTQQEASNYTGVTGFAYITLAPDMADDSDSFPSVQSAWRSITPCYRVGVNRNGEVKVFKVRTSIPAGTTLDTTVQGTWFENQSNLINRTRNHMVIGPNGEKRYPASDFVTPEMLENRTWWTL